MGRNITGKLPYVTWQKLKRDKVSMEQWPEQARRAYARWSGGAPIGRDASVAYQGMSTTQRSK